MKECTASCKTFTGGEKKHHPDCLFYPHSMSERLDHLEAAAKDFVNKVETGRARSTDSYNKFKAALTTCQS